MPQKKVVAAFVGAHIIAGTAYYNFIYKKDKHEDIDEEEPVIDNPSKLNNPEESKAEEGNEKAEQIKDEESDIHGEIIDEYATKGIDETEDEAKKNKSEGKTKEGEDK